MIGWRTRVVEGRTARDIIPKWATGLKENEGEKRRFLALIGFKIHPGFEEMRCRKPVVSLTLDQRLLAVKPGGFKISC